MNKDNPNQKQLLSSVHLPVTYQECWNVDMTGQPSP